ncbi:RluA family pseudouridine synthase [Hydrotalea sandarakina]|jgi:23S rRNA pseudouridine955/2504/2580 synthase/23S rRNA pseudouridine1911/1915/1917 synthase|uniref:23S rRNA pseudouridine955/2504/2580 synthase n=1 Tax=Hydrotalea sandarakina TaxID=1004304 RepID=A0A2W7RUV1_9BACT|nr:RluA family pseudouridine synthase [Hydrotalea sandarakina]PZX64478.1 23S rRNA pseudouridine955/2504/2580 synthase [Hydrotalea sandarakina]
MKPEIIFENEFFVAVHKPSGLLSIPDRMGKEQSLKDILIEKYQQIYTVHRLDKDTSGVIVFAKDEDTHRQLSLMFEERRVKKIYNGLIYGVPVHQSGTVDVPIIPHPGKAGIMTTGKKGKPAITDYVVVEQLGKYAWMQFEIHTGRTHQIRVHMKYIGHSIVCDALYGDAQPLLLSSIKRNFKISKTAEEERPLLNRLALHASELSFEWQDQDIHLAAPLPKDLRATLQQLRKWV